SRWSGGVVPANGKDEYLVFIGGSSGRSEIKLDVDPTVDDLTLLAGGGLNVDGDVLAIQSGRFDGTLLDAGQNAIGAGSGLSCGVGDIFLNGGGTITLAGGIGGDLSRTYRLVNEDQLIHIQGRGSIQSVLVNRGNLVIDTAKYDLVAAANSGVIRATTG